MKKILVGLLLLQSISGFAYDRIEGLCKTSKQENPWIKIEMFTATSPTEKTYAIKYEYSYDGTLVSTEKISGDEPDYNFTKAMTEDGEKIFIIDYLIDSSDMVETYQYVCAY